MFEPINLSAFADPVLDVLVSGSLKLDETLFFETIRQAQGSVLELGCGHGRATIPLAQQGIDMTGLELSAPSLAYARQQAGDLPIQWIEADVRVFHLDAKYALIFARGTVFQFMLTRKDQDAMLSRVWAHLDDGSQFMFDVWYFHPDKMVDVPEAQAWYTLMHPNKRQISVSGTDRFDHVQQQYVQTCYERWDKPDGELVRPPWELTLRLLKPQEVETVLDDNRFRVISQYADWDGSPATDESSRMIYICEKR